ncbi:MAG: hypothetical protein ACLQVI_35855 [Polyangiaceae bacterium]
MKSTSRVHGQSLALVGSLFLASCGSSGPATPTITSATAAIDSITVTWTSVPGSASYNVYDALTGVPSSSNSIDSNSTNSPTTSLTFTPSSLGVPLVIAVTAVDPNGNESNDSGTRTIATLVPTAVAVVDQVSGTKNLLVSWDAVSGAASYNVYATKSATSGGPAPTANGGGTNVAAPATSDAWDAVTAGDYYTFAVTAVDAAGNEGGISVPFTIVAPAQP